MEKGHRATLTARPVSGLQPNQTVWGRKKLYQCSALGKAYKRTPAQLFAGLRDVGPDPQNEAAPGANQYRPATGEQVRSG